MDTDEFFYLGRILKPTGIKGHLAALLDTDDPERYRKVEHVFIAIDRNRIPYAVESFEIKSARSAILKLEGVDSFQDAVVFSGREIHLPLSLLPKLKGKKFYHHEVTGFTVIDSVHGNIGSVTSVLELSGQSLLQVHLGTREILIPLAGEVIRKIDRKKKVISIQAPEGLIDIYL